jgi:hypothetical protein
MSSSLIKGTDVACYALECANCLVEEEVPEMPGWRKTVRMTPFWGIMEWTGMEFVAHFFDDPSWAGEQEEYTQCPRCGVKIVLWDPNLSGNVQRGGSR